MITVLHCGLAVTPYNCKPIFFVMLMLLHYLAPLINGMAAIILAVYT